MIKIKDKNNKIINLGNKVYNHILKKEFIFEQIHFDCLDFFWNKNTIEKKENLEIIF